MEGSRNNFLYTSFPGPIPPSDAKDANSFAYQSGEETAGARRRRQRLYPRLAGKEINPTAAMTKELPLSVEDLLSGSLKPAGEAVESASPQESQTHSKNTDEPHTQAALPPESNTEVEPLVKPATPTAKSL